MTRLLKLPFSIVESQFGLWFIRSLFSFRNETGGKKVNNNRFKN
jgi:hypothetical protein